MVVLKLNNKQHREAEEEEILVRIMYRGVKHPVDLLAEAEHAGEMFVA